jgi:hypothetical protein
LLKWGAAAPPTEGKSVLHGEKILQELFAESGEDRLGMELNAFDFVTAMPEAHDDAVAGFGGNA